MAKKHNVSKYSINKTFKTGGIILGCFSGLVFISLVVMTLLYFNNENEMFASTAFVSMIILGVLFLLCVACLFIYFARFYKVFYLGLFDVSKENMEKIAAFNKELELYPQGENDEFNELNKTVNDLKNSLNKMILANKEVGYTDIELEYINEEKTMVSYESLVSNIRELIFASNTYRNAFVEFDYDIDKITSLAVIDNINNIIRQYFRYPQVLVAPLDTAKGFLVYVPRFDSINQLEEEIKYIIRNATTNKTTIEGNEIISPKASVVIYPYSDKDGILSDLRYAGRQGQVINLYMPSKMIVGQNKNILQSSLNVNNISKIIEKFFALSSLDSSISITQSVEQVNELLKLMCQYLNIDEAGTIMFDDTSKSFRVKMDVKVNTESTIFSIGHEVNEQFIKMVNKHRDPDKSYFFSSRTHVNDDIGRFLDVYGINSGQFFVVEGAESKVIGIIYLINKEKDLYMDSYLRESLLVFSAFFANYLASENAVMYLSDLEKRNSDILKFSNYNLYTIDITNYNLLYVSDSLKDMDSEIKVGRKCYKAIWGLNKPCPNCPLATKKKMNLVYNDRAMETSLAIHDQKGKQISLIMKENNKDYSHDRFDQNLLINSYYSLVSNINNAFLTNSKGNILLISIDNILEIVEILGSEFTDRYLRRFINAIQEYQGDINNIFTINSHVLAIYLPESGRTEIINIVEKIYSLSKVSYEETQPNMTLVLSYITMNYPQSFATSRDFLRHVDKFLSSYRRKSAKDSLFFEETKYTRSASHRDFLLSVIDEQFGNKSFNVKLQPIMQGDSKRMLGAEILIRLSDEYQGYTLNTDEVIKVAGENGKIGVISEALTDYIGGLYQKFGFNIFKTHSFERISLNTDFSYFDDPEFIVKINALMNKYFLPKDFLAFEITEKDIFEHLARFKEIFSKTKLNDVVLVVDQYTGEYLSLEKIREMGFSEIKIPRFIVNYIDKDEAKFSAVKSLVDVAKSENLKVTLVGVENSTQVRMIKEERLNCYLQGYYFYKPLDTTELIEAIRNSNVN